MSRDKMDERDRRVAKEMQDRDEEEVREKRQVLEELAIAYDQRYKEAQGLEDELQERVTELGEMKVQLLQLAACISDPDPCPEEGAPRGERPEELTDWMLEVKDDEIQKQGHQIKELKCQVTASRDEELRIRAQAYWMRKEKDDEIQERCRLIRELRSQVREKEELLSTARVQLQALDPQPLHLRAPTIRPPTRLTPSHHGTQDTSTQRRKPQPQPQESPLRPRAPATLPNDLQPGGSGPRLLSTARGQLQALG